MHCASLDVCTRLGNPTTAFRRAIATASVDIYGNVYVRPLGWISGENGRSVTASHDLADNPAQGKALSCKGGGKAEARQNGTPSPHTNPIPTWRGVQGGRISIFLRPVPCRLAGVYPSAVVH